jgi:IS30 family transposase
MDEFACWPAGAPGDSALSTNISVKIAEAMAWEIVKFDSIGPWKAKTPSGVKNLRCFTAIDPATSWPEICKITDKRSQTVMDAFHNKWLCRHHRHIEVTFDNGSEFKSVFEEMCENLGIKCRPTTSFNY